jgi:hypothetical protein
MHRFMRCAALALLATACVSTGTPTAPSSATTEPSFLRTPQHFTIRFPLEVTAVALCTGEQISLVGELREAVTLVSDETGALLHVTDNGTLDAVGTGSVTGAKYLFHDAHQSVFNTLMALRSTSRKKSMTPPRTLVRALWTTSSSTWTSTSSLPGKA